LIFFPVRDFPLLLATRAPVSSPFKKPGGHLFTRSRGIVPSLPFPLLKGYANGRFFLAVDLLLGRNYRLLNSDSLISRFSFSLAATLGWSLRGRVLTFTPRGCMFFPLGLSSHADHPHLNPFQNTEDSPFLSPRRVRFPPLAESEWFRKEIPSPISYVVGKAAWLPSFFFFLARHFRCAARYKDTPCTVF